MYCVHALSLCDDCACICVLAVVLSSSLHVDVLICTHVICLYSFCVISPDNFGETEVQKESKKLCDDQEQVDQRESKSIQ